ncbi:MAG: cytochrome c [Planctomycetes bacterium]|nr:cytochrome c [Planctomycetota bacterium]
MLLRWGIPIAILLATIAALPFAYIAKARVSTSTKPRLHGWQDMDIQPMHNKQGETELFRDKRLMRPPVAGTVARGEDFLDTHLWQGRVVGRNGKLGWANAFPPSLTVDRDFLDRGRERYEIYCSMCHGYSGQGDGAVHQRVMLRKATSQPGFDAWAAPASYHTDAVRSQPLGQLFNTISNGKNNMAGYRAQIPAADRWAIVAYVKALQHSKPADAAGKGK